ncbi:hypothetical protein [Clostridium tepidum]|uniref:hypothetical protein n=1 Tax=Clostridium tepidum TaxID=1962263 RepID=UPI0026A06109
MELLKIVEGFNNILWSYILMFFLFGAGIFFTFNLKFVQVRKFKVMFKQVCLNKYFQKIKITIQV